MTGEKHLLEIAELASRKIERRLNVAAISWLKRPDIENGVADAASVFSIQGESRRECYVVILSNQEFPNAASDAAEKAVSVAGRLPDELAQHVLLPLCVDRFRTQSFAVYPELSPFSENKFVCKLEKMMIEGEIYQWLCGVANSTRSSIGESLEINRRFLAPLEYILEEPAFSDSIRQGAAASLLKARRTDFSPLCIVEHGDLWMGNILFSERWGFGKPKGGFAVIDWGTANIRGYPFIDLLRFHDSSSKSFKKIEHHIRQYSEIVDIPLCDLTQYVLAALGYLGLNRNQFPMDRYLALSERCFAQARRLQDAFV
jgi:hypothetical protein